MTWLSFRIQFGYAKEALAKKNWEKAKIHFKKAAEIDRSKIEASLGLAEALYNLNEKNQAVEILEGLIQHEPDPSAYFMLGRFTGDEAKLEKSVELDSKNSEAWYELGKIRLKKKNDAGALKAFQRAALLDLMLVPSRFEEVKAKINSKISA